MHHGELIYVMGPSGSGKDSVMEYARNLCPGSEAAFAHRYITRPSNAGGENHIHILPDEYQARLERGLFSLNWDSHGFRYGIGNEIDIWMQVGFNVVVNGSRAYLPEAAKRYPTIRPVLITVDLSILRERLLGRGRESLEEVERRLERANAYEVRHPNLERIDNSGELSEAGEYFLSLVRKKQVLLKKAI